MSYKRKQPTKFKKIGFYENARSYTNLRSAFKPTIFCDGKNIHSDLTQKEMQAGGKPALRSDEVRRNNLKFLCPF